MNDKPRKMTAAQFRMLNTIIGKVEHLQGQVDDRAGNLARAKTALFQALAAGDRR